MDDFLHNLRSGKLKQPDRTNRQYNDQQYKGGQRRPMMDRRKREFDNKDSSEKLSVLKDVLESLADTQKRMVNALEARNKTEDRKARAMEILARNIYRMINPNADDGDAMFNSQTPSEAAPYPSDIVPSEAESEPMDRTGQLAFSEAEAEAAGEQAGDLDTPEPVPAMASEEKTDRDDLEASEAVRKTGKLTIIDQQALFPIISKMRDRGESWERIARHISDQGYPTLSGKGVWRGVMVKTLFERMSA